MQLDRMMDHCGAEVPGYTTLAIQERWRSNHVRLLLTCTNLFWHVITSVRWRRLCFNRYRVVALILSSCLSLLCKYCFSLSTDRELSIKIASFLIRGRSMIGCTPLLWWHNKLPAILIPWSFRSWSSPVVIPVRAIFTITTTITLI